MWKKYVCAPVERRPGVLVIAVDDPHDLTRLDGIRAMNLSPRYDFWVGMKHEILAYIARVVRREAEESPTDSADLAKILDSLGEGEAQVEEEEEKDRAGDRRDRFRHRQARQPAHHRSGRSAAPRTSTSSRTARRIRV